MKIKAYAKINLTLDVTGVRENGYHDVAMVMQQIGIYDELEITKAEEGISLVIENSNLSAGDDNLIVKAAKKFFEFAKIPGGAKIVLTKNIPMEAGLAGGSTDAAATLKGLNELYETKLSDEKLCEIGVKLGADIPFCIVGGTALCEGIGEVITKLKPAPEFFVAIVKPSFGISTKFVYDNLAPCEALDHPDTKGMLAAMEKGDKEGICACLKNVLESVTIPEYPLIDTIKDELLALSADGTLMSGSGTTVYGLFIDEGTRNEAVKRLKDLNPDCKVFATEFVK